jgi:hypothetical protein
MGRAPIIKSGDWGIFRVLPPPFSPRNPTNSATSGPKIKQL